MVSGGRSMLQANVDETTEVIKRLISTVPMLIHNRFAEVEKLAYSVAIGESEGDDDVYLTVFNSINGQNKPEQEEWMIQEFYRSSVLLICSFAETTLKGLLKNPEECFKSNYLCCAYKKIREENGFKLKPIGKYWKRRQIFTKTRNDVAHNRREVIVSKEELFEAIDGVHALLRAIADAFEEKRIQMYKIGDHITK